MLTEGDNSPFFITLAIAEVGRVSSNGLLYDKTLVDAIARQLQGSGGIQGHIPAGEESTNFPIDAVDWVGHVFENDVLWAKAYVPPGETREYIRRLKARSGKLGTSIFGYGEREFVDDDQSVWTSNNFDLHSVDLAPAKMAALSMGGDFIITAETTQSIDQDEEGNMPISIHDVPDAVREQIIRQAQIETDAQRVNELETENADLQSRLAETEAQLGERDATITQQNQVIQNQRDTIASYRDAEFTAQIDTRIVEATDWVVRDEKKRDRLQALRNQIRVAALAEMNALEGEADETAVETAIQTALDANQLIIETMRDALGGPASGIGGVDNNQASTGSWESYKDNPEKLSESWGTSLPKT